ncbi:MAG: FeoB-associated Cys-rich membrane protein [Alphaproteobacteria bacterium]
MVQGLIVAVIVVSAAAWTSWHMVLRGWLRKRAAAKGDCGPDCACGD